MEIEGEFGLKIVIKTSSKIEFGRGLGFPFDDRTVSRHHISIEHRTSDGKDPRVYFEVLGKNPIWVFSNRVGNVRVFRNSDKGEMRVGDSFCVSVKHPTLFTLKISVFEGEEDKEKRGLKKDVISVEEELAGNIQSSDDGSCDQELGFGSLDVSDIDPVKEFGFMVMGREFDNYPKKILRDIKHWDWFLESPRKDSEDDEVNERNRSRGKKGARRKKEDEGNNDDDWSGESEDEKLQIAKLRSGKRPKYTATRSKDSIRPLKDTESSKRSVKKKIFHANKDEEEEDKDSLGGFIVNDEEPEEEDFNEEEEDYDDDDSNGEEEMED